jgi:phosphatidylserine/phosphatidylglycerophosphate/cardiolipin synthase-like enzyme
VFQQRTFPIVLFKTPNPVRYRRIGADSFGLFGSGNLTAASFQRNVEVAMMLYGDGLGRTLLHELNYWANGRLRTLPESTLVQRITAERK